MNRYHKKIFFPVSDELKNFNDDILKKQFSYSKHCLDNLKYRFINNKEVLLYIKNCTLNYADIFEYYKENNIIIKACYRINYKNNLDFIIVIDKNKTIITIYLNNKTDEHETLKQEIYNKE